ncbi:hypothetical protein CsatA_008106 [Cannabis sativa]
MSELEKFAVALGYDLPIQLWWRPYGNSMKDGTLLISDKEISLMAFDMKRRKYRKVDIFLIAVLENSNMKSSCTIGEFPDTNVLANIVVNPQHEAQEAQHEELNENVHQEANEDVHDQDNAPKKRGRPPKTNPEPETVKRNARRKKQIAREQASVSQQQED